MAPLNEMLLAEAREAQAAQAHAQARAELARVRFADAVRRLHGGGASMREIAGAFGISHQRVHQIVTGHDKPETAVGCSFCGAGRPAARALIAGPGVRVCNGCVAVAGRALAGEPEAGQQWAGLRAASAGRLPAGRPADDHCSFCRKAPGRVPGMADGGRFRICRECLDLCEEIIAEERGGG